MLKIKELLKNFIETQNQINESLKGLREDLKPKITTLNSLGITTLKIDKIENCIESNIYTKEQTIETINKECDYRERYKKCQQENADLLHLIETYFKYNDKYEVLNIFDDINRRYVVEKVED